MKHWIVIGLSLALAACASQPRRSAAPPVAPAAAEAAQNQREAALRADSNWSFAGRIAVTNGRDGGSGRLEWRQQQARYEVSLSAPVTRQSWRLTGDAGSAQLEGLEGGTRTGSDAGALLREATGWEIPVVALADWVRGVRAAGPAAIQYDDSGRPSRIEQGGWQIDYSWPAQAATPVLPSRIDARRGEARVKLIVDRWGE